MTAPYSAPATPGAPGVVVIHEAWGLDAHIRDVADRLAKAGYAAIAPDLFGMEVTLQPAAFIQTMTAVRALTPEERAVPEKLEAAFANLPEDQREEGRTLLGIVLRGPTAETLAAVQGCIDALKAAGAPRVAVMGFCYGGAVTWACADAGMAADAFAPFYGRLPAALHPERVKAPVEGHFGGTDHGIPVAPLEAYAADIRAAGGDARIHVYDGAPHAFFNDTRDAYAPEAAALAWERLLAFFARTLR